MEGSLVDVEVGVVSELVDVIFGPKRRVFIAFGLVQ
jgi:hypothetical protein